MKVAWKDVLGIAALALSLFGLVIQMDQLGVSDARKFENRLTLLESAAATTDKEQAAQNARIEMNAGKLVDYNVRLDRLERAGPERVK